MDDNAARFMLMFRQHALRRGRTTQANLSWREINWAFHSNSQDILVDMVSRQFHGKLQWEHARESGMFMWMSDSTALVRNVARAGSNVLTRCSVLNSKSLLGMNTRKAI